MKKLLVKNSYHSDVKFIGGMSPSRQKSHFSVWNLSFLTVRTVSWLSRCHGILAFQGVFKCLLTGGTKRFNLRNSALKLFHIACARLRLKHL